MKEIKIFTDGCSRGNPGPGGYGVVMIYGDKRKEISGGYRLTTNNRMEILAVIEALTALKAGKRYNITINTDSKLIVNAFNDGWLVKWQEKGWMRNHRDRVLNEDLWKRLLELTKKHDVKFVWIPGHSGIVENERCDFLANNAAASLNLPEDNEYNKETGNRMFAA